MSQQARPPSSGQHHSLPQTRPSTRGSVSNLAASGNSNSNNNSQNKQRQSLSASAESRENENNNNNNNNFKSSTTDRNHDLIRRLANSRKKLLLPETDPSALLLHISETRHFQMLAPTWISRHYPDKEEPLPANPLLVSREQCWNNSNGVEHTESGDLPPVYPADHAMLAPANAKSPNNNHFFARSNNNQQQKQHHLASSSNSMKNTNSYTSTVPVRPRTTGALVLTSSPSKNNNNHSPSHRSKQSIMQSMTSVAIKHPALIVDKILRDPIRFHNNSPSTTARTKSPTTQEHDNNNEAPGSSRNASRPGTAASATLHQQHQQLRPGTAASTTAKSHNAPRPGTASKLAFSSINSGSDLAKAKEEKKKAHRQSRYSKLSFAMCCDGFGCPVSLLAPGANTLGIRPEVRPRSARSNSATPSRMRAVDSNLVAHFVLHPAPMRGSKGEGAFMIELATSCCPNQQTRKNQGEEEECDEHEQNRVFLTVAEVSSANDPSYQKAPQDDPDLETNFQQQQQQQQNRPTSRASSTTAAAAGGPYHQRPTSATKNKNNVQRRPDSAASSATTQSFTLGKSNDKDDKAKKSGNSVASASGTDKDDDDADSHQHKYDDDEFGSDNDGTATTLTTSTQQNNHKHETIKHTTVQAKDITNNINNNNQEQGKQQNNTNNNNVQNTATDTPRKRSPSNKKPTSLNVFLMPQLEGPPPRSKQQPSEDNDQNANTKKEKANKQQPKRKDARLRQRWQLHPISGVLPTAPGHAVSAAILDVPLSMLFTAQRYRITSISNPSLSLFVDPQSGQLTVNDCGSATTSLSSAASFLFARHGECKETTQRELEPGATAPTSSTAGRPGTANNTKNLQHHVVRPPRISNNGENGQQYRRNSHNLNQKNTNSSSQHYEKGEEEVEDEDEDEDEFPVPKATAKRRESHGLDVDLSSSDSDIDADDDKNEGSEINKHKKAKTPELDEGAEQNYYDSDSFADTNSPSVVRKQKELLREGADDDDDDEKEKEDPPHVSDSSALEIANERHAETKVATASSSRKHSMTEGNGGKPATPAPHSQDDLHHHDHQHQHGHPQETTTKLDENKHEELKTELLDDALHSEVAHDDGVKIPKHEKHDEKLHQVHHPHLEVEHSVETPPATAAEHVPVPRQEDTKNAEEKKNKSNHDHETAPAHLETKNNNTSNATHHSEKVDAPSHHLEKQKEEKQVADAEPVAEVKIAAKPQQEQSINPAASVSSNDDTKNNSKNSFGASVCRSSLNPAIGEKVVLTSSSDDDDSSSSDDEL